MYRASLGTRGESRRAAAEAETAVVGRVRRWERIVRPAALAPHVTIPQWVRGERPPSTPSPKRGPPTPPAPVPEIPLVSAADEADAEMPDAAPPNEKPSAPATDEGEIPPIVLSTNPVVPSEPEHVVEPTADLDPMAEITSAAQLASAAQVTPAAEVSPSADVTAAVADAPESEGIALAEVEDVTSFAAPPDGTDPVDMAQSVDPAVVAESEGPMPMPLESVAPMELVVNAPMDASFPPDIPGAVPSGIPELSASADPVNPPDIADIAPGAPIVSEDD